jgi:lysophospholipase L1-like esterase
MPLSGRAVAALALMAAVVTGVSPAGPSPAHKTLRIVALGDSTTATALDWAPPIKEVYADCLPRSLAAHGISATVVNAGIGDTTTRDALARLDRDVRSHHPDLVVIQFGINDSWIDVDQGSTAPRLTRTEYRDNLGKIIAILKSDGAQVVLMTPNPMRWADPYYIKAFEEHPGLLDTHAPRGIDRLLDLYAADVRDVAHQEQVPLVDVFAAFEDYGKVPGHSIDELLLAGDGIHPNQAGQHLVCKLLTDRIAGLYRAD